MADMIENFCQASEIIVASKLAELKFDKTIQAKIVQCADESLGKYKIKYQDTTTYAYAIDSSIKYKNNISVYVSIQEGDINKNKTILGTVDKLESTYGYIANGSDESFVTSANLITTKDQNNTFGLKSKAKDYENILYSCLNRTQDLELDDEEMPEYLAAADGIKICADVYTELEPNQRMNGSYGIGINFDIYNKSKQKNEVSTTLYFDSLHNFIGQPYDQGTKENKIFQSWIFPLDKEHYDYLRIHEIFIYQNGFPGDREVLNTHEDIFISNIQVSTLEKKKDIELVNYTISFEAPNGTFFTNKKTEDIELKPILKEQGKKVPIEYKDEELTEIQLEFLWFKQDLSVDILHPNYHPAGGIGWRCLNKIQEDGELDMNMETLLIKKEDTFRDYYKVIIYRIDIAEWERRKKEKTDKEKGKPYIAITTSDDFLVKNLDLLYNLEISSSKGTHFVEGRGGTDLTAEAFFRTISLNPDYLTYRWGKKNNLGQITLLNMNQKNFHVNPRMINIKDTYYCEMLYSNEYIGMAEITLYNSTSGSENYLINIENSSQMFVYSQTGLSPSSKSLGSKAQKLKPLSLTLYDNYGNKLSNDVLKDMSIVWEVGLDNSLVNLESTNTQTVITEGDKKVIYGKTSITYSLLENYNNTYYNNNIKVTITAENGETITAETNFIFTKQGDIGTSGTAYTVTLSAADPQETDLIDTSEVLYVKLVNNGTGTYSDFEPLNFYHNDGKWLNIHFWKNGDEIYCGDGITETKTTEDEREITNVKWSFLGESHYAVDSNGVFGLSNKFPNDTSANIVKVSFTYDQVVYSQVMPIVTFAEKSRSEVSMALSGGFYSVDYDSSGLNPTHKQDSVFHVDLIGYNEDFKYEWKVCPKGKEKFTKIYEGLGMCSLRPTSKFKNIGFNNSLAYQCYAIDENGEQGESIGKLIIPIIMHADYKEGMEIDEWTGDSLKTDEGTLNPILAVGNMPTGGVTFENGYVMSIGEVQGESKSNYGLYCFETANNTAKSESNTDGTIPVKQSFFLSATGDITLDPELKIYYLNSKGQKKFITWKQIISLINKGDFPTT